MAEEKKEKDVVIKVRGLVNGFGNKILHDHIDLDVYRGEVLGVVGGSGAGKSVLLNTIIGLRSPQAGTVKVFGQDIQRASRRPRATPPMRTSRRRSRSRAWSRPSATASSTRTWT